ncbi:MAG: hypothetical protein Q4F72_11420 [Desulfovibrionaceae bacterium]|nr:hypothetical protein [Desulfovibrionaceae bacterium]
MENAAVPQGTDEKTGARAGERLRAVPEETLAALERTYSRGGALDEEGWIGSICEAFAGILRAEPRMYRSFGPWWWGFKRVLAEHGCPDFGSFTDRGWEALADLGSRARNVCAACACGQERLNISLSLVAEHTVTLIAADGSERTVPYVLKDPDMEALADRTDGRMAGMLSGTAPARDPEPGARRTLAERLAAGEFAGESPERFADLLERALTEAELEAGDDGGTDDAALARTACALLGAAAAYLRLLPEDSGAQGGGEDGLTLTVPADSALRRALLATLAKGSETGRDLSITLRLTGHPAGRR